MGYLLLYTLINKKYFIAYEMDKTSEFQQNDINLF